MALVRPEVPLSRLAEPAAIDEPLGAPVPEVSSLARNSIHLLIGQVGTVLLSLVFNWALGRWVGAEGFGDYYVVVRNVGFAYLFVEWGQAQYVVREVACDPNKAGLILATTLVFRCAVAVLMCGPAVLAAWLLGDSRQVLALTAIFMLANLPQSCAQAFGLVFRGREAMHLDAAVTVTFKSLAVAITIPLLMLGGDLTGAIVAQAGAGLGGLVLAVAFARRGFVARTRATVAMARELLVKGGVTVPLNLASFAQPFIDAQVLMMLASRAAVGWFAAAMLFVNALLMPAVILGSASYPSLSRASHDRAAFRTHLSMALRPVLIIGGLVASGTFLFADLAVTALYSRSEFGPAVTVLQAYAPGIFLLFIDIVLGTAILAVGRSRFLATAKIAVLALAAVLDWSLVPIAEARWDNGGLGVVLSFTATELIMLVSALCIIPRGCLEKRLLADVARIFAVVGAVLLGMEWLPQFSPVLRVPVFLALFGALALMVGLLRRDDLAVVRHVLSRLWRATVRENRGAPS